MQCAITRRFKFPPISFSETWSFPSTEELRDGAKAEGSTRLAYTGCHGGLEHLKIETTLIDERFASVMGECVKRENNTRRHKLVHCI
jgi:hypothetical protein